MATKLKGRLKRETSTVIRDRGHSRPLMVELVAGSESTPDVLELRPKDTQYVMKITLAKLWGYLEIQHAKGRI